MPSGSILKKIADRKKDRRNNPAGNDSEGEQEQQQIEAPQVDDVLAEIENALAATRDLVQEQRGCGCMD